MKTLNREPGMLITLSDQTVWPVIDLSTLEFDGDPDWVSKGLLAIIISVILDSKQTYAPTYVLTPTVIGWADVFFKKNNKKCVFICRASEDEV